MVVAVSQPAAYISQNGPLTLTRKHFDKPALNLVVKYHITNTE